MFQTSVLLIKSYFFRTFVRVALVWFCLFSLPLGVWEGQRPVIGYSLDFSLTFFF